MTETIFDSEREAAEFTALMQDPAARQAFVELKAAKARDGARNSYQHILKAVGEYPWAITPGMLGVIVDVVAFRVQGGRFTAEEIEARVGPRRRQQQDRGGEGVAVLGIQGTIMPKADLMTEMSGGTSLEGFRSSFRQAMAAGDVGAIVLDVDSPGGMVNGVPEMAAEIRAARGSKPIIAVANTTMASGAFWLAAQADEIVVSRSSQVGSVGVVTVHEDHSQALAAEGVKPTIISAGEFKTEGNPFEPLGDDARAFIQSRVNAFNAMFEADLAKGRRMNVDKVRSSFGQGRMAMASEAIAAGMADRMGSLDEVIADLLSPRPASAEMQAAEAPALPLAAVDPEPVPDPAEDSEFARIRAELDLLSAS